jgi:hypothetical protein
MLWARDFCRWLDGWTYYRPLADIERIWTQHFEIEHDEDAWFRARFPSLNVPSSIARFIVRRFAGLVLVGVKAPQQGAS